MKNLSKTIITVLALTLSGTAFAETAKPAKPIKLDTMTTQSVETITETMKCDGAGFKMMKACGDANKYPVNALSGMNLN
jgi:hypothetical protein